MIKGILATCCLSYGVSALAAETLAGQYLYQYQGGTTYRVNIRPDNTMHWVCIAGDEIGASGVEKPDHYTVAPDVHFNSWTEKSGVQVSQVLDLHKKRVISVIIAGKERFVLEGKVVREK